MKKIQPILVKSKRAPIVEIDFAAAAMYIRFGLRGTKVAKKLIRHEWPHVAIDLNAAGDVVGVEALGMTELTIGKVLEQAALKVDDTLLRHARYIRTGGAVAA